MNIYQHANNMRRFLVFVGIVALLPFLYVVIGPKTASGPYSAKDPIAPKRLFQVVRLILLQMICLFHFSENCDVFFRLYRANTRRCFDVDSTSFERYGRQMDVETTLLGIVSLKPLEL